VGRFDAPLKSGEHRFKGIGGGENDFGKFAGMVAADLRRKNIFQFVSEFAELVETAGCGIAFERVHGATDTAKDFFVGRTRLEFQSRFVEGLEEFRGALKEESAELGAAIVVRTLHPATSRR
jgi:hypothetical protein